MQMTLSTTMPMMVMTTLDDDVDTDVDEGDESTNEADEKANLWSD